MKGNGRGFWQGVICAVIVVALMGTALASSGTQNIAVTYKDINLVVDGTAVTPKDADGNAVEPFIYNGTTYLPVRAVGEALGKDVTWDGDTNTVYLGAVPDGETSSYSRTNPAPVGTEQKIDINEYSRDYTVSVKINSVVQGSSAWSKIRAANQFNDKPGDGKEYILADVTITADQISDNSALSVYGDIDFDAFSSENAEYDRASVVEPEPSLVGDIYKGGSITGYVCFLVDTDDAAPKIVYGRNYDGSGGIWFALRQA